MKWLRAAPRKNGHGAEKLIDETRRLREQLVAVAAKLEVYLGDFQEEVDHQRGTESGGGSAGATTGS